MASAPLLLRHARLAAGLTQRELARRAGVAQPVIAAYERGRRSPSADALLTLLAATGHELRVIRAPVDVHRAGRLLLDALDLADALPKRQRGALTFPRLPG